MFNSCILTLSESKGIKKTGRDRMIKLDMRKGCTISLVKDFLMWNKKINNKMNYKTQS